MALPLVVPHLLAAPSSLAPRIAAVWTSTDLGCYSLGPMSEDSRLRLGLALSAREATTQDVELVMLEEQMEAKEKAARTLIMTVPSLHARGMALPHTTICQILEFILGNNDGLKPLMIVAMPVTLCVPSRYICEGYRPPTGMRLCLRREQFAAEAVRERDLSIKVRQHWMRAIAQHARVRLQVDILMRRHSLPTALYVLFRSAEPIVIDVD